MKKALIIVLSFILTIGLAGCSSPVMAQVIMSDKDRETEPDVSRLDLDQLVSGNSQFAFDLYQVLKAEEGNLFYSPYSISAALAMTYAGARGETEQEMANALSYYLSQNALHPAFNKLDLELAMRGEGASNTEGEGFQLHVTNAIWGQKDYDFLEDYLNLLAENYGAGLRVLDFINHSEKSREFINQWVSEQTEGRIEDLIPKGGVNAYTRLVLTNAIYFNAAWKSPFDEERTQNGEFYLADGNSITVPMMNQTKYFGFYNDGDSIVVELPYDGDELSMVIFANRDGSFSAFEDSLDWQKVEKLLGKIQNTRITLTMPRFEFESEYGLRETLMGMGMEQAFTDSADFSGINGNRELLIQDVVHKAFVSVDEAGTEAAAATGVILGTVSVAPAPLVVTLDSPFVFLIRDIETGAILFAGRVMNPAA